MTATILDDIYRLNPGQIIDLFVLDATAIGGSVNRFHSGLNELNSNVVWQGENFFPFPIEWKGLSKSTQGKQARPTVMVANINSLFGTLLKDHRDLVGSTFTRKRTIAKYLDAVNFSAGNASADPNAHFPEESFVVNRKVGENKIYVELELATLWEVFKAILPARKIIANSCVWGYTDTDNCTYDNTSSPWYGLDDEEVFTKAEDKCGKRISSCKLRFTEFGPLRFSSFPSAGRV